MKDTEVKVEVKKPLRRKKLKKCEECQLFHSGTCQYQEPCAECERKLGKDVGIMCCKNEDGKEMVLCSNCWFDYEEEWREEGWKCDEDE